MEMTREQQIAAIEKDWAGNPRWKGLNEPIPQQTWSAYVEVFSQQIHLQTVALANYGI